MTDRAQQRSSKGNTHYLESSNDTQASVKQSFACRLSASHTRRTHEVTSSYRGPSSCDVSAIFLLLPPATRAHSPSPVFPPPPIFDFHTPGIGMRTTMPPYPTGNHLWFPMHVFVLVGISIIQSFFVPCRESGEITDTTGEKPGRRCLVSGWPTFVPLIAPRSFPRRFLSITFLPIATDTYFLREIQFRNFITRKRR